MRLSVGNRLYFFQGDKYAIIHWTPDHKSDTIAFGPAKFVDYWMSLRATGFSHIDAILPIPGQDYRAYFFSGLQYACIDFYQDKIHNGPDLITKNWASLAKAGFNRIDGAIMVPGRTDQAYFFSGNHYCRIKFTEGKFDDQLLDGPKSNTVSWSATKFMTIDRIVPVPGSSDGAYIFSGDQYVHIKIVVGGTDELIAGPQDVGSNWPILRQIGFY
jgi:hypothetical protein